MIDEVTIILTTPEAVEFREFQKNRAMWKDLAKFHETFAKLVETGVFDIQYGKATIHFRKNDINLIQVEEDRYRKLDKVQAVSV